MSNSNVKFLYNPANDQVLNSTPMMLTNMDRLKLVPASETILRAKRPDLFEVVKEAVKQTPAAPVMPTVPDSAITGTEALTGGGDAEGDFLAQTAKDEPQGEGLVMDPNRLTLLVEAIGQLDPATDYTVDGKPVPAKIAKIVGGRIGADERDFAFAEFKRQQAGE